MKKANLVSWIFCAMVLALVFSCASSASVNKATWDWQVNGDESNGGSSTIVMTEETREGLPAYSFTGNITNQYEYGFVNVKLSPDDATLDLLKQAKAVSFRVLGDGDKYAVKIITSDVKDYAYFEYVFETLDGQPKTVIVPVDYLFQPSWGTSVGSRVKLDLAEKIEFQTTRNGSPGPYAFKLWDFRIHTAGIPNEKDLLPKGAAKPAAAPAAAAAPKGIGGDLGALELNLVDNFQYGDGYQGIMNDKRLFNGHKITPGEKYTLKITYTASRDLEDVVEVGLVDGTPAANYWRSLTWDDAKDLKMAQIPQSKAGEKVSATINFTTVAGATGASTQANQLVFLTKGAGTKGSPGSGKQKAVKFTFSEFVFTKD